MRAHLQFGDMLFGTILRTPLLRSFRRDWWSWSRAERSAAIGILVGAPVSVASLLFS